MESDEARADRWDRSSSAMEDLAAANVASNATMVDLVNGIRKEAADRDRKIAVIEKSNRQQRNIMYVLSVATVIMLVIAVINAINIGATKDQQNQIAAINKTLLDCTNYTGECGRANAAKQEEILDEVKKYNLIGFYCIRNNPAAQDPRAEKFLACMDRLYPGGPDLTGVLPTPPR